MTEQRAIYKTGNDDDLKELLASNCCKRFDTGIWEPPTHAQWSVILKHLGWSQRDYAAKLGLDWNEKDGCKSFRRWKADPEKVSANGYAKTPYTAWRLLLVEAGLVVEKENSLYKAAE